MWGHLSICCSGLCLDSLGSSCIPKKIKLETHPITVYVNATPYCTSIELEHHRGPCKCECGLNPGSCNSRQHFLSDTCTCQCLPHLTREKVTCLNSTRHVWDSDTCQCTCKHITVCNHGQRFDANTCECRDMYRATCDNTVNTSLTTYKVYLMNVILMGVLVIIVVISIYWLACKNGKRRSQVSNSKYFSKIFKCHFLQLRYSNNIYHQAADTDLGGEENIIIGPCRYSLNIAAARDKTDQEDELD